MAPFTAAAVDTRKSVRISVGAESSGVKFAADLPSMTSHYSKVGDAVGTDDTLQR
jgi:hypothetical protein